MRARFRGPVAEELQFIVFRVGREEYALGIMEVERVLPLDRLTPAADAPVTGLGAMQYAGQALPVLDLRRRWGSPGGSDEPRVMVVNLDGVRMGLAVDQVSEVLRADSASIAPHPANPAAPYATGLIRRGERQVIVCNPGRFLSETERLTLDRLA
jgi:purine-binding chemotaxis protein CheW